MNTHTNVYIQANGAPYHISRNVIIRIGTTLKGNATLVYDGITSDMATGYDLFTLASFSNGTVIDGSDGLTIQGHHTGGWTNAQMSAIAVGNFCQNIIINHVTFKDLVGFSIHQPSGTHTICQYNRMTNCGNGLNVNADGTLELPTELSDNDIDTSEGIEAAAPYTKIERNKITNALAGAIALGGDTSGRELPGMVARNNIINGVTANTALGIEITYGCVGALVELNEINDTDYGVIVTADPAFPIVIRDTLIQNNTVRRARHIPIYLPAIAGITGTVQQGNVIV